MLLGFLGLGQSAAGALSVFFAAFRPDLVESDLVPPGRIVCDFSIARRMPLVYELVVSCLTMVVDLFKR